MTKSIRFFGLGRGAWIMVDSVGYLKSETITMHCKNSADGRLGFKIQFFSISFQWHIHCISRLRKRSSFLEQKRTLFDFCSTKRGSLIQLFTEPAIMLYYRLGLDRISGWMNFSVTVPPIMVKNFHGYSVTRNPSWRNPLSAYLGKPQKMKVFVVARPLRGGGG